MALLWLSPRQGAAADGGLGQGDVAAGKKFPPGAELAAIAAGDGLDVGAALDGVGERTEVEAAKWRLRWAACSEDGLALTHGAQWVCLELGSAPGPIVVRKFGGDFGGDFDGEGYAELEVESLRGSGRPRGEFVLALDELAMESRDGRVLRKHAVGERTLLGRVDLSSARLDVETRTLDLGLITVRPPSLVGSFRVKGTPPPGMRMHVMLFAAQGETGAESTLREFIRDDFADEILGATGMFGRTEVPFAPIDQRMTFMTFGTAEVWQISLAAPVLAPLRAGRRFRGMQGQPRGWTTDWAVRRLTGTDIGLDMSPATGVDLFLTLDVNPGVRTVLIRETRDAAAPLKLDARELQSRIAEVAVSTAGISERIAGMSTVKRISLGRTNLNPWTSYAFEAWSGADAEGVVTLLSTQFVDSAVGYSELVVK